MASELGVGVGMPVGSALLALWILVRFPELGSRSLRTSIVLCVGAMIVCKVAGTMIGVVVAVASPMVAMLAVAVPVFVFAFWSGGALMRMLMTALPGR